MNVPKQSIILIDSKISGPTLAIIAGVHGNELTGPLAMNSILPKLKITKGMLYIIFANPLALKSGVRQINKNLNRCFYADNNGNTYEDVRAREIMNIMDKCDAMLDLHAFNEPTGDPFIMTEPEGLELAKIFDVKIISTNWTQAEPDTTDGYMHKIGKIGLCLECGPIPEYEQFVGFAQKSITQFLSYYNILRKKYEFSNSTKRIIKAKYSVLRTTEKVVFSKQFKSFDKLDSSEVFCKQGQSSYVANTNECIIFPRPLAQPGSELFVVGEEQEYTA